MAQGQPAQNEESAGKAYGRDFARRFWLDSQKSHVSRSLNSGVLAVTQIRSPLPTPEPSGRIPYDEAYLIALMVEHVPDHELWQDGRAVPTPAFPGGSTVVFDLRRDPVSFTRTAHHSLHFYLPRSALAELATRNSQRFDGELRFTFANPMDDPVVRYVGQAALALLDVDGSRLALDCLMQSLVAHVLGEYGNGGEISERLTRRGLSPRLVRRAQEFIDAKLSGSVGIAELAELCGLSPAHFSREFKRAAGMTPHQWLQRRRTDLAKSLLLKRKTGLAEIAADCGFADQSHFTRVFAREVGETPSRWLKKRLD